MSKELPANGHRTVARLLRVMATERIDRRERQELMLRSIKHEAMADELDRLKAEENSN